MKTYRVEVSATAERQLQKLGRADQRRLLAAMKALALQPKPRGSRKMESYDDIYRIRIGVFRIIYSVEDEALFILVLKIGHRKSVYR